MDLRIPLALLLPLLMAGCQGHFVGADGRPLRPFQDGVAAPGPSATAPADAPGTPAAPGAR